MKGTTRLGPTLLPHYHFSEFLFFVFLPLISIGLESLTTFELFELGREVNLTENSPLDLGDLFLTQGRFPYHYFSSLWLSLFRKSLILSPCSIVSGRWGMVEEIVLLHIDVKLTWMSCGKSVWFFLFVSFCSSQLSLDCFFSQCSPSEIFLTIASHTPNRNIYKVLGLYIYEVCSEGIQPCNMKNRNIYWRRYKKHCT